VAVAVAGQITAIRNEEAGVDFGHLVGAGLNVAPPAVFVLGIGGLVYGLWPRAAVGVTYGVVVWSFLVETIASTVDAGQWLRDTSPLLHITPAPAAAPDWVAAAWLVGLGLLAAAAGVAAFSRRDLQGA
jgi:ABC-2 type transport system permease protein